MRYRVQYVESGLQAALDQQEETKMMCLSRVDARQIGCHRHCDDWPGELLALPYNINWLGLTEATAIPDPQIPSNLALRHRQPRHKWR